MHGDEYEVTPKKWAFIALTGKYEGWGYEEEYRLLTKETYIESGFNITAIYLGANINDLHRELILKLIPDGVSVVNTKAAGDFVVKTN